jgi:restriction system protein
LDVKTAAAQVLQQAGTALHAKDIAEQIMAAGLWQSDGKTPDATVSARLYSDIKNNGDKSPFVKVDVRDILYSPCQQIKKYL